MEKSHECDEVGRATKSGQNFPESFSVDGLEGLSQINESYKYYKDPCFVPDISLEFAGPYKDHIHGSSRYPETTLALR